MRVPRLLGLVVLLSASLAPAESYWPRQSGLIYTYERPDGTTLEMSVFADPDGTIALGTSSTSPDSCASGSSYLLGPDGDVFLDQTSYFCPPAIDPTMFFFAPPLLLIDAQMQAGQTRVESGNGVFLLIEVVERATKTVPLGTFEVFVVRFTGPPLPFPHGNELWLHVDRGPIRIGDAELVSITGAVHTDDSNWGSLKARFE